MRLMSFNVQNLRLRRKGGRFRLDGARDGDEERPDAAAADEAAALALDAEDRRQTAAVIAGADADVVCLQEVFAPATLDHFHDRVLLPAGAAPWPYRACLPGNDGHGRDIAVMSRRPLLEVESHARMHAADLGVTLPEGVRSDLPLFRRDCLRVAVGRLTLWLCHLKAPYPDAATAWAVRRAEAEGVARLVARHHGPDDWWLILGDLNEPAAREASERAIAPLLAPLSEDLLLRLPEEERWSYRGPDGLPARPDACLASPALARAFPDVVPRILRVGMGRDAGPGARLPGVGAQRPHASDHAAILVAFPGL
ncbi:MAG: endonuclease/exonuclease/phosphatase family protein [Rhodobacteraceae bacterium]|nr:endonuclease/exonuclease/phosphatase family protein [Paracoccaceae bacterium]